LSAGLDLSGVGKKEKTGECKNGIIFGRKKVDLKLFFRSEI
jgi:hypothetical protein